MPTPHEAAWESMTTLCDACGEPHSIPPPDDPVPASHEHLYRPHQLRELSKYGVSHVLCGPCAAVLDSERVARLVKQIVRRLIPATAA